MGIEFIYPEFEVIRNTDRCISCRVTKTDAQSVVYVNISAPITSTAMTKNEAEWYATSQNV